MSWHLKEIGVNSLSCDAVQNQRVRVALHAMSLEINLVSSLLCGAVRSN